MRSGTLLVVAVLLSFEGVAYATTKPFDLPRPPFVFEANLGQTDAQVKFVTRARGFTLYLTPSEAAMVFRPTTGRTSCDREPPKAGVLRMKLAGANPAPEVNGLEKLPGRTNYLKGRDVKGWRTNIPTYARVQYRQVYPGVDLEYYGRDGQLEYDFMVAPGADPDVIMVEFDGAKSVVFDARGDLRVHLPGGEIVQRAPTLYQEIDGARRTVAGRYVAKGPRRFGIQVSAYDASKALVIDPVLVYSTFLGGSTTLSGPGNPTGGEAGTGVAVASDGSMVLVGATNALDFPTANPIQAVYAGGDINAFIDKIDTTLGSPGTDVFVTKINPAGSALVYSTYLGGSRTDVGQGIAVGPDGSALIAGYTRSPDFPLANPLQPSFGGGLGGDAFVTKISSNGAALLYSTYLGGSRNDAASAVALDADGSAYVTGTTESINFPTASPIQAATGGDIDAFITKINASGSALMYSTYLGGSRNDGGFGIAVDATGAAFVTGDTASFNFPTVNAIQPIFGGGAFITDAFVTKINPTGSALVYSTYLGGFDQDRGLGIALGADGSANVTGWTISSNFPTANAIQPTFGGFNDAFVTKINAAGSALVYSTYLGGTQLDRAFGIAVDTAGASYVTGVTGSSDFPVVRPIQATQGGFSMVDDVFVTKINPAGSALVYSTYLGGGDVDIPVAITLDAAGTAYVTGFTNSVDFPTVNALQPVRNYGDAFLIKVSDNAPAPSPLFPGQGQRDDVNHFLSYARPLDGTTELPPGVRSFVLHIVYGPTINAATFAASLNGVALNGFTPIAGTNQSLVLRLQTGRNVLLLEAQGVRSDGRTAVDRDRLVFIVP